MNRALTAALAALTLLVLAGPGVGLAAPGATPPDERVAAQAELAALAPRIEALKREAAAGRGATAELERLLGRAQALAAVLERTAPAPPRAPAPGPDSQELRERADALRDRADKEATALAEVERHLVELARRAELAERLDALGAAADLFADGAAGRGSSTAGRATEGNGASGPGPTGPGTGPGSDVGSGQGPAGSAATALRSAAEPGVAGLGVGPEDAGALKRRKVELSRSVAALRAQADALDAEARAAEGRR
jgi:hypothetical protein